MVYIGVYRGYVGRLQKKMETTILCYIGLRFRFRGFRFRV